MAEFQCRCTPHMETPRFRTTPNVRQSREKEVVTKYASKPLYPNLQVKAKLIGVICKCVYNSLMFAVILFAYHTNMIYNMI